jgi:hypothetical protein
MIEVEKDAEQLYSQMITLLLSWQIARYTGKNQAGAVKKTARKLLNETKDAQTYETFKKIARCQSDFKVIETMQKCFDENKRLGYL